MKIALNALGVEVDFWPLLYVYVFRFPRVFIYADSCRTACGLHVLSTRSYKLEVIEPSIVFGVMRVRGSRDRESFLDVRLRTF